MVVCLGAVFAFPWRFVMVGAVIATTLLSPLASSCSWSSEVSSLSKSHEVRVVEANDFDVVIAGGSTAAFAAAIASARSGARTALLEPTNWVGGQLTASGVPAIDEAWHTIRDPKSKRELLNVAEIARHPANITPNFLAALNDIPDCGDCWVSRYCFRPDVFLAQQLVPLQKSVEPRLIVYLNTVVKRAELSSDGAQIRALMAIRRTPQPHVPFAGYDCLPSQDIRDWYSAQVSDRFDKEVLEFIALNRPGRKTVFIDATEWGELLVLADAPYLQGVEEADGQTTGDDRCGQATVFCFVEQFHDNPAAVATIDATFANLGFGDYKDMPDAWEKIWTYRRLRGQGAPAPGDLSLQNWGYSGKHHEGGNDYPFGYLFHSRKETARERADWRGGVDLAVMAAAEQRALAWHEWYRQHAPPGIDPRAITLAPEVLGTGHGLAKLPYIRDTRRSIGLDGFLLKISDLAWVSGRSTGTKFEDRIALGAYPADVHPLVNCRMPRYVSEAQETLPFYIPFRSLTNQKVENLLVAGKTMAQSFLANSATRLQPTEWSTGTAAGVVAAHMSQHGKTSRQALANIQEIQRLVSNQTPIDWTIPEQGRDGNTTEDAGE